MSAADQEYINNANVEAAGFRAEADRLRALASEFESEAAQLHDYADFYIALESEPYTQAAHWVALFTQREAELQAEILQLEGFQTQYEADAEIREGWYETAAAQADARELQVLAPVQEQINDLRQDAVAAQQNADALRDDAELAAAQVARMESQLALLNASLNDTGNITWWRADQVDAEGRVTQELLGNGVFTLRDYDPRTGLLLSIQTGGATLGAGGNTTDIQDVGYSYDAKHNVESRWDANVHLNADYGYDSLDRLTSARITHPSVGALNQTLAWGYDAMGNFSHRTANGVRQDYGYVQETLTASGGVSTPRQRLNTVGSLGSLVHDANGSLTQSGNRSFGFNAANQPVTLASSTDSVSYTYGPDRNRIQKVQTQGGKTWSTVYAGTYERTRYTGSGNGTIWEERYPLYAGNRLIGTRMRITTAGVKTRRAEYYHEDALGSVEVVTDSSGFIMKRYQYDPFGGRTDITALGIIPTELLRANPFNTLMLRGYTGHEHIDELGLIHMNGRVYDTLSGRFLSADPNLQAPYDTQSFNRYAYVKNNPLKYTDPSGYFFKSLFKKLKKYWRPLLAIAIAAFAPYAAWAVWGQGMTFTAFMASGAGFVTAVGSGFAAGMVSSGGDIRAGLLGAATAGAFWGVGATLGEAASLGKVVAHGLVGGVSSVAQGGKFMHGFLSAGFTEAFAPGIRSSFSSTAGQVAAAAVVGGTASAIGGGKFANGAVTGAFSYAFGRAAQSMRESLHERAISVVNASPQDEARIRGALSAIEGTPRGRELMEMQIAKGVPVEIRAIESGGDAGFPNGGPVYFNVNGTSDTVLTTAGRIPFTIERVLAHELGHAIAGTLDNGAGAMNNVRINENPIVTNLNPPQPERIRY